MKIWSWKHETKQFNLETNQPKGRKSWAWKRNRPTIQKFVWDVLQLHSFAIFSHTCIKHWNFRVEVVHSLNENQQFKIKQKTRHFPLQTLLLRYQLYARKNSKNSYTPWTVSLEEWWNRNSIPHVHVPIWVLEYIVLQ